MKDFQQLLLKNKKLHSILTILRKDLELFLIPLLLLGIFFILFGINSIFVGQIKQKQLKQVTTFTLLPYPFVTTPTKPFISANSGLVMEADSRDMLYTKNIDLHFSMASTTKIMTALVGLEYFKPTDILTVKNDNIEGSSIELFKGEQLTFENLLYAMFLPSANDAAYTIADNYPGGLDAFIKAMNEKAQKIGMKNTRYFDPAGLEDDGNYTTPRDLSRLAQVARKNSYLGQIYSQKTKIITDTNGREFYLENLNKLLGTYGVKGIKTGFTTGAGGVLITLLSQNRHDYIIIVMQSMDRFADTQALFSVIENTRFIPPNELLLNSNKY